MNVFVITEMIACSSTTLTAKHILGVYNSREVAERHLYAFERAFADTHNMSDYTHHNKGDRRLFIGNNDFCASHMYELKEHELETI